MSILSLNMDVLYYMSKFLSIADLSSLSSCCKKFSTIFRNDLLKKKITHCFQNDIISLSKAVQCGNSPVFKFILSIYRHLKEYYPKERSKEYFLYQSLIMAYKLERYADAANIFNTINIDYVEDTLENIISSDLENKLPLFILILSNAKLSRHDIIKMIISGDFKLIQDLYDLGYIGKRKLSKTVRYFLSMFTIRTMSEKCKGGIRDFVVKIAALDNMSLDEFAQIPESHWSQTNDDDEIAPLNKQTADILWGNAPPVPVMQMEIVHISLHEDLKTHMLRCYKFEPETAELMAKSLTLEDSINIAVERDPDFARQTNSFPRAKLHCCFKAIYLLRNNNWILEDFDRAFTQLFDELKPKFLQQVSLFCCNSDIHANMLIEYLCSKYFTSDRAFIGTVLLAILEYPLTFLIISFSGLWKYPSHEYSPYLILEKLNDLRVPNILEILIQKRTVSPYIYWAWLCNCRFSETAAESMKTWKAESNNDSTGFRELQEYIKYLYLINNDNKRKSIQNDNKINKKSK
jgi:hypothetical protein